MGSEQSKNENPTVMKETQKEKLKNTNKKVDVNKN